MTDLILACGSVNKFLDSWNGHVRGQLEIPISEDISDYTITLRTDKKLSNIQVCSVQSDQMKSAAQATLKSNLKSSVMKTPSNTNFS